MAVYRSKIRWTIPGAGTAYSVLHWSDISGDGQPSQAEVDTIMTKMDTFCQNIISVLPSVVTVQPMTDVEHILSTNGQLENVFTGPAKALKTGTGAVGAGWAAAAGGVITWSTAGVRNGRRVRGRTFIVPLSNEVWDVDGTIKTTKLDSINIAAEQLRTASAGVQLCVHTRPSAPGATDGDSFSVTGHRVPDMSAILRSRRS